MRRRDRRLLHAAVTFVTALGAEFCTVAAKGAGLIFRVLKAPVSLLLFLGSKLVFSVRDGLRAVGGGRRGAVRYISLWLMPVAAAALLAGVAAHFGALSVGLRISVGDTVLGYLRSEAEFLEARNDAARILSIGADDKDAALEALPETSYAVDLINVNRFSSADTVRDALLDQAGDAVTDACGVYLEGEFLCAVRNQNDAKTVFDTVLAGRQTAADGSMTSFLQHVEYLQGRYPADPEVLWTREKLNAFVDDLLKTKILDVKEMKTEVANEAVPYESVEIPSDAMYIGTSRVLSKGRAGSAQVTRLVTYVNGEKTEEEELHRVMTQAPVAEQLQVGTRALDASFVRGTSYGGVLIWPAVGATHINSDFAYRWGRLHAALDIGSGSGTSLGKTVVAAAEGTVVIAGVHSSYGYYVKIDHGNGMQTLYAHCMAGSLMVSAGDHVSAGTPIARIGMTGYATGPHLHFEVIINGTRVDPKPYLGI